MGIKKRFLYYAGRVGWRICNRYSVATQLTFRAAAKNFLQELENVRFNMDTNGERRALKVFSTHCDSPLIFDVGANIGDWSALVTETFSDLELYSFEVVPDTAKILSDRFATDKRIKVNCVGLSNKSEQIKIWRKRETGGDSTAFPIEGMQVHKTKYPDYVTCDVTTGSEYLQKKEIKHIDVLKIDTEGMELRVLKGFGDRLENVRMIQFEYGIFNISSRDLLIDFFNLLRPYGFTIGKIFPRGVEFFDYHFTREDLAGNNYIAVKKADRELLADLAGIYAKPS